MVVDISLSCFPLALICYLFLSGYRMLAFVTPVMKLYVVLCYITNSLIFYTMWQEKELYLMLGFWILPKNLMCGRSWVQKVTDLLRECKFVVVLAKETLTVCILSTHMDILKLLTILPQFIGTQLLVPAQMECFYSVVEETLLELYDWLYSFNQIIIFCCF